MRELNALPALGRTCLVAVLVASVMVIAGAGVSAAPEDDIEAMFNAAVEEWNAEDTDAFASHFTEEGLVYQFYGLSGNEALEAVASDRADIGAMTLASISEIVVNGTSATAVIEITFESGYELFEEWEFHMVNGVWMIGPGKPLYRPIPAGVPAVDLTVQEYAFVYDEGALSSGNFGFNVTNKGQQDHEVVIVSLEDGAVLSDVVDSVEETGDLPSDADLAVYGGIFEPGATGTLILPDRLEAGRYAFVCFLPSPDGVAHAVLGMRAEFTVGGDTAVSAPNTGDAGLSSSSDGGSVNGLILGGLGLTVAFGILVVFARLWRRRHVSL